jgi:FMN phosphatase YigB (HAD superfamily)
MNLLRFMLYKWIFVDVDGVIRNFVDKFKEKFQRDFPAERILREDCYDLKDWTTLGEKIFPWVTESDSAREIFLEAEPHRSSLNTLFKWIKISEASGGYPKFALITRQRGPRILWTQEWLEKFGLNGSIPAYYTVGKVPVMLSILQQDAKVSNMDIMLTDAILIDDSPKELDLALKAGIGALCFHQSWNQEWKGPRIFSLSDFNPFEGHKR